MSSMFVTYFSKAAPHRAAFLWAAWWCPFSSARRGNTSFNDRPRALGPWASQVGPFEPVEDGGEFQSFIATMVSLASIKSQSPCRITYRSTKLVKSDVVSRIKSVAIYIRIRAHYPP